MRRALWAVAIGWLAISGSPGPAAPQATERQAEAAFQAAFKAEVVDGDLKSAIEQYRKLAESAPRALAARALLRLGLCWEKLGDEQARRAYDRVVRDFADQKEPAAEARRRLSGLGRTASAPSPSARRIWAAPPIDLEGSVSADGRLLAYLDRAAGRIAVRDLATGRTLTLSEGGEGRALLSPDGSVAAVARAAANGARELRLVRTDGSGARTLFRTAGPARIEPGAWSPDGSRLAVVIVAIDGQGEEDFRVALISASEGTEQALKAVGPRRPGLGGFSPDGRFLVCDYPASGASEDRDVSVVAADGGREARLEGHPADDVALGWAPDGSGILYIGGRSGRRDVEFTPVAAGRPGGQAKIVYEGLGPAEPLGLTRAGAFVYALESGGTDASTASLDPMRRRLTSDPVPVDARRKGRTRMPAYSPDGRSLAYFADRGGGHWLLCLRTLASGTEREIEISEDLQVLRDARWSADGRSVFVAGYDDQRLHAGFYRVDIETGIPRAVLSSNPEAETMGGRWAPDGRSIYLIRAGLAFADKSARILSRDVATGDEREVRRVPAGEEFAGLALSPDGRDLACVVRSRRGETVRDRILIGPVQGGVDHEVAGLGADASVPGGGLAWAPDGKALFFIRLAAASGGSGRLELWSAARDGGAPEQAGVLTAEAAASGGAVDLSVRPDGAEIAFQSSPRKPEVWILENLAGAIAAEPAPATLAEASLEAWVKAERFGPGTQALASKGNHSYEGACCALTLRPDGRLQWGVRHGHTFFGEGGDSSIEGLVADAPLRPGVWTHVLGTAVGLKSLTLYLDGVAVKSGPLTQTIPNRPREPLDVGRMTHFGEPAYPFFGKVEGAAFYERALSADEVRRRYQAGRAEPRK